MAKGSDRHLDELYGAPLSAFTQVRDRLARQLGEAGRPAEAADLRRLRKPSAALWTVNQLARRDPASMGRFIEVVNRLKRAHTKGAGEVGEVTASQRAALSALLDRAPDVMKSVGLSASPAMLQRISNTLLGAAADRGLQDDLRRGRLDAEQPAPGFEVLAGTPLRSVPAAHGRSEPAARPAPARRETQEQKPTRQERRDAMARARRVRQLQQLAARHRRAAEAATARAERLGRQLRALQEKAAAERTAADTAEREARQAAEARHFFGEAPARADS
jgi:hypothetical protein